MALKSGFFNSKNKDRVYNAEDFGKIFNGIITDGVFANVGDRFRVEVDTAPGYIKIGTGRAWINGHWIVNTEPLITPKVLIYVAQNGTTESNIGVALKLRLNQEHRDTVVWVDSENNVRSASDLTMASLADGDYTGLDELVLYLASLNVVNGQLKQITQKVGTDKCPYVTGILQNISISEHLTNWDNEFTEWFNNTKDILTNTPVGNLQQQINEHIEFSDSNFDTKVNKENGTANNLTLTGKTERDQDISGSATVTGWSSYNGVYRAYISNSLIKSNHSIMTVPNGAANLKKAFTYGTGGLIETQNGGFYIYSVKNPSSIGIHYWRVI